MTTFLVLVGIIAIVCVIGFLRRVGLRDSRYTDVDASHAGLDRGGPIPLVKVESHLADQADKLSLSESEIQEAEIQRGWVEEKRKMFAATCAGSPPDMRIQLMRLRIREHAILGKYRALFQMDSVEPFAKQYCGRIVGSDEWKLPNHLELQTMLIPDSACVSLAFASYTEFEFSGKNKIQYDFAKAMPLVDAAILAGNASAVFLKGLMLKYGLDALRRPFSRQSKPYLERALEMGIDGAEQQLAHLAIHYELDDLRDGYNDRARVQWT